MSFTPVVPFGGYAGWAFLKRTMAAQTAAFAKGAEIKRDEDYFRARIGGVKTADDLVSDRRLLKVALEAFGLGADIDSKAFIRKILADGTLKEDALANKLADKQYAKFSAAFGFGDFKTPRTQLSDFPDTILSAWRSRSFEAAVGEQDGDLRLGLNAERELLALASKATGSEDSKWFTVMGSTPLRSVFEKALGLPSSFAALDIDQQLQAFKDKAEAAFGETSVSQFSDATKLQALVRKFLIRSEAEALSSQIGPNATALQLMSQTAAFARSRWQ